MNSIRSEVDGDTLANQIRLERASHKGSFFLVEGNTDANIFEKFINEDECQIIVCLGKKRVIDTLQILKDDRFEGSLGIIDKDFNDHVGYPNFTGDVVYTDENDMEILILCSPALSNVLREYGVEERLAAEMERYGQQPCQRIFEAASKIGALRMISVRDELGLKFDEIKYRFVRANSFELDIQRMIKSVLDHSTLEGNLDVEHLFESLAEIINKTESSKRLCCGHDCVRILGRALRSSFGNTNSFDSEKRTKELERILRLSYEYAFFKTTEAYKRIRSWEVNFGFTILQSHD